MRVKTLWIAGLIGAVAAGCGGPSKLYLQGLKPLNRNELGENTPVDVRVYLLRDRGRFERASFEDLWVNDREVLEEDRVRGPRVLTVLPGDEDDEPQVVNLGTLGDEVRFIGLMGLFSREEEDDGPRHMAVPIEDAEGETFVLKGYSLRKD